MTIKKKIVLSFVISAAIIFSLVAFEYINYVEMRREIRFLELTDTIRSKSLQLRRHEKNYFLYSPQKSDEESSAIFSYIEQLRSIVDENMQKDPSGRLRKLDIMLEDYTARFNKIKGHSDELSALLQKTIPSDNQTRMYYPLIELTFLERPLDSARFLENAYGIPHHDELVDGLVELDADITALRKNGEDIIEISNELDKSAIIKVERVIGVSQNAILIFFPVFLVVGTGTLFLIAGDVAKRLEALSRFVESTGRGDFNHAPRVFRRSGKEDELGVLVSKFSDMGQQLALREQELIKKNEELLQTRKLAAIGTLASGVAHELNNPLNNIYISAQVLKKETGDECPAPIRQVVDDIVGQTARVKRIVGDLLEFARMKEPALKVVDLCDMVERVFVLVSGSSSRTQGGISFSMDCPPEKVVVDADPGQMERVFINLIANAVDAMHGNGAIHVEVRQDDDTVSAAVSDTGEGIDAEMLDKVFEPFYTTKDRGTGLGLSISFNIIKKHGGDISVVSEMGAGTTFTVRLPRPGG
jgi:signal transduction histidine kinase